MIYRSFSVNFLFAICSFIFLKEAKMQTTTGSSSSSSSSSSFGSSRTSYHTDINNGELGIKIQYDSTTQNPKMYVTIYYDTETTSATNFFQQQFKDQVLTGFTGCGVVWDFIPCGTSKFGNTGALTCLMGDKQCEFDQIHACVATMLAQDQVKVGQFVICFFNNNKNVDQCLPNVGLNSGDVHACAGPEGQGANECNAFNTQIHPNGSSTPPPGTSTGSSTSAGTTNFKGVLCGQFANVQLKCNVCPA